MNTVFFSDYDTSFRSSALFLRDGVDWGLIDRNMYKEQNVYETYGYITKNVRIENDLPKEHYIDARCISGNPKANPLDYYIYQKCVRRQNRQIYKNNLLEGGRKKNNQLNGNIFGFKLFDTVKYQNKQYFVFGKRKSGFLDVRNLDGEKVNNGSINCKKLKRIKHNSTKLTESRRSNMLEAICSERGIELWEEYAEGAR